MPDLAWTDCVIVVAGVCLIFAIVGVILYAQSVRRVRTLRAPNRSARRMPVRREVLCADCKQAHHTPYPASRVEPDRE